MVNYDSTEQTMKNFHLPEFQGVRHVLYLTLCSWKSLNVSCHLSGIPFSRRTITLYHKVATIATLKSLAVFIRIALLHAHSDRYLIQSQRTKRNDLHVHTLVHYVWAGEYQSNYLAYCPVYASLFLNVKRNVSQTLRESRQIHRFCRGH